MQNGICPKCGSNEVLGNVRLKGESGHPPYIDIHEPEPENRPFMWIPKFAQSQFKAFVCGACGYTEFYADNYKALNDGRKNGFVSS